MDLDTALAITRLREDTDRANNRLRADMEQALERARQDVATDLQRWQNDWERMFEDWRGAMGWHLAAVWAALNKAGMVSPELQKEMLAWARAEAADSPAIFEHFDALEAYAIAYLHPPVSDL